MRPRFRDIMLYMLVAAVIVGGAFGILDTILYPGVASQEGAGLVEPVRLRDLIINPVANVERIDILLIGADDRVVAGGWYEQGRSDTLIVMSLSPKHQQAVMLSLPRDLLVRIPEAKAMPKVGFDYPHKLNAAYCYGALYGKGGVPLTLRTVERELGMSFDYYAKIDLDAFVEVVDMLGGVELEVPDIEGHGRGMNYDDEWGNLHIHLQPGRQHLDGEQAMGFVRYRQSNYRNSRGNRIGLTDVQRAENQQKFLKAMVEQKVKLTNLPKLLRAGRFIMQRIDTDMDWRTAYGLLKVLRGLDTSNLLHLTLPVETKKLGGIDYCEVPEEKMLEQQTQIVAFLEGGADEGPPEAEQPLRVQVLNGCGIPGAAGRATEMIRDAAVKLDSPANADSYDYERTIIEYRQGTKQAAQRLARRLGVKRPQLKQVSRASGEGPDLTITLGHDFSAAEQVSARPAATHLSALEASAGDKTIAV